MNLEELNQLIWGQHNGPMSIVPTQETILDQNPKSETYGQQINNPNPEYRYQLNDGTWFEAKSFDGGKTFGITNGGTAIKAGEIKPAEGQTRQNVVGGNVVQQVYRGGDWIVDTSVAPQSWGAASTPNEGDARQTVVGGQIVTQVYRNGDWIIDVSTPPKPFDPNAAKEGATRDTVVSGNVVRQVYRNGDWVIDPTVAPRPWDPTKAPPKEGDTRQNVIQGQVVQQVYRGGDWVVDPNVAPTPYDPTKVQPKEGDARETVVSGQIVTQVYRAGDWIVDPSVAPKPFDPSKAQPKEGDTRDTVVSGQVVKQVYRGGDWVIDPTVAPKPFDPNKPTEGVTRQAIEGGYNVTQTYTGGEWVTTAVGARATPMTPTDVTAPADRPYITRTDEQGNVVTITNPNYQPKTVADVAGQVGRLQQAAQAKRDELTAKVQNRQLTQEQAAAQFDTWWQQNVESQKAQLDVIQRQAAAEEQRKAEEASRANLTAAQTAGKQAADIAAAARKTYVGPGYGAAVNAIMQGFANPRQPLPNIDYAAATTYSAPSLQSVAEQATANFLKGISPTAAALAGGGQPPAALSPGVDVNAMLNRSTYRPTVVVSPTGEVTVNGGSTQTSVTPDMNAFQSTAVQNPTLGADQIAQMMTGGDISSIYGGITPYTPMARGGIVDRPTLALIGERGPEAVVPLGRPVNTSVAATIPNQTGFQYQQALQHANEQALANSARLQQWQQWAQAAQAAQRAVPALPVRPTLRPPAQLFGTYRPAF